MRNRSIAFVLTALFTVVACVTIGAACVVLYMELRRELANRQAEELAGKIELIRHLASEVRDPAGWSNLQRIIDDIVIGHGQLRVWISDSQGAAIYGGRRMPTIAARDGNDLAVIREDGVPMRGLVSALAKGEAFPGSEIIVALDERAIQRTLAEFRLALAAATIVSVVLVAGLGRAVARRALAPVRRIAEEAAMIDPARLGKRLDTSSLPAELRELGAAFNGVLDRLALSYEQMEASNADVAHELRTPLANLIAGTELALSAERDAAVYRETLGPNMEELERMKSMVNDMLFLARADRGERVERYQSVRLDEEAKKVLEYYESALDEAGIKATVTGAVTVPADPGLIRRALSNLVSNAIRYTPRGGSMEIGLGPTEAGIEVYVLNPGPEIDPQHLPNLFARFFRVDKARTARDQQHGLGLAIVKAIASMHGGDVFATSQRHATRIGFRLPANSPILTHS
ncbi:MAG: heavy metal sensor histidine kinase [Burkholderiales bacterium]